MRGWALSIYIVFSAVTIAVAALINPDRLNDVGYWANVTWLLVLGFANWAVTSIFFIQTPNNRISKSLNAIIPSLHTVVFIYSITSAAVMLFYSYFLIDRWQLAAQLIVFGIFFTVSASMVIAAKAADAVPEPETKSQKTTLIEDLLKIERAHLTADITHARDMKRIREFVSYSLPSDPILIQKKGFQELCAIVKTFADKCENGSFERSDVSKTISTIERLVNNCR